MNIEDIGSKAAKIILEVGQYLRDEFNKVQSTDIEFKQRNHLVSYVDKTAEQRLVEQLSLLIPNASFLVEEGTVDKTDNAWQWIIDPLDGTTNFLHHIPFYAISVALQFEGQTKLGWVYEVSNDELFYSFGDNRSYVNQKRIYVRANNSIEEALLCTGFPYYDYKYFDAYMNVLTPLLKKTRGIRRCGSAALDLVYVAAGRYDGYFEYSLSPWDVAAGAFIVQQAGGKVSDFSGGSNYIHGKEIIAANPTIFIYLNQLIQQQFYA